MILCYKFESNTTLKMTKKELRDKQDYARILYFQNEPQDSISSKVGVSKVTISKWVNSLGWKEKRAAENITRPELINKLLRTINDLIDQVGDTKDPAKLAGLGDKLSKFTSAIEKLDKKANIVTTVEVFMAFSRWLEYRSRQDSDLTPELFRAINRYQDLYVTDQLNKKR